jgi:hypothetical protein
MTPDQSHVAGLELALAELAEYSPTAHALGEYHLRPLIHKAKSAPAEVAQGADKPKAIGYINKKDLARLQDEITWDGTYLHIGVDHFAQWLEDTPYEHLAPIYAAPPSPDWREHSRHIAKGEQCPETIETLQAAWDRDQELINDMRHEIARHKTRINRLEQRRTPSPDAELVELLRDARKYIAPGAVQLRIDAKLASL